MTKSFFDREPCGPCLADTACDFTVKRRKKYETSQVYEGGGFAPVELTANDNTPYDKPPYTWFWLDLLNGPADEGLDQSPIAIFRHFRDPRKDL